MRPALSVRNVRMYLVFSLRSNFHIKITYNILKAFLFFFCTLCFSVHGYGQTTISGSVSNEKYNFIPYASIGIADSKTGTITDKNGHFILTIRPEDELKPIIFRADGYNEKSLLAKDLRVNSDIILSMKTKDIEEVIVKAKKLKEKTIGEKTKPVLTFSRMFEKDFPSVEQGSIFKIYNKTKIKAFSFHLMPSSRFQEITLKLNVYDIKNGQPNHSLLQETILYKVLKTGWQTIDLQQYKLNFNGLEQIAVTLQLVDYTALADDNFVFGLSAKKSLSENLIMRDHSQALWTKNSGTFISNLQVGYDKNYMPSVDPTPAAEIIIDKREKFLQNFYIEREKGLQTAYGNNPDGQFLYLPDADLYYEEYGEGAPLILLEGNNGIISDFHNQIPFLSRHFRVIALDSRNQGHSTDRTTADYGYEKLADDLYRLVTALDLKKVNIMGLSDGGITGLLFNAAYPEFVNKLIVMGANTNPDGVKAEFIQSVKDYYTATADPSEKRRLNLMLSHPEIRPEDLRSIYNPVLVIAGEDDVIKETETRKIAAWIKSSKLIIIPNAGHHVTFDQPEAVNKTVLDFLKEDGSTSK